MSDLATTEVKLATAKQKKETADQAFKKGDVKAGEPTLLNNCDSPTHTPPKALFSYHEASFP
jgi:hypothetical protein